VLQVGNEGPAGVRVPDKSHLEEMRAIYAPHLR
jgi:hypothetical protein